MRKLFFAILIAALAWSGWWWVGSTAKRAAIDGWLAERRAQGWVAEYADMTVTGYPNRFDTVLRELRLADPSSEWAWSAPQFQVLALSYKPNHVIAVWPETQTFGSPYETVEASAARMRGSVVFEPDTKLALARSTIEIEDLALKGSTGWNAALEKGLVSTRQSAPGAAPGFAHDLNVDATNLRLPRRLKRRLDRADLLPEVVKTAYLDATLAFDAPWDRRAVEGPQPDLTALNIKALTLTWGQLDLRARGTLVADAEGYPEGTLDLTAKNWREMLELGVRGGLFGRDLARTLERGLGFLAGLKGDDDTLDVSLSFSGGQARLGPVPLGPVPRLN